MMRWWRRTLVGGGIGLVVGGIAMAAGAASLASGQETAVMALSPASQNVPVNGDTFILDINVQNVENLGSWEVTMEFNKNVLEYVGMAEEWFLRSTGRDATCQDPGSASSVNSAGKLNMKCATTGLVDDKDGGVYGPSGTGTIARVAFKPKAVGKSDLKFVVLSSMSSVEVCLPTCPPTLNMDTDFQNGVINVFDPNAPTPTGVPATPTRIPRSATPDMQATAQAVLGPTRRLSTPVPGAPGGTISPGSNAGGSNTGSGAPGGAVIGASGPGSSGAVGPDGAPIAGHGPQGGDAARWPVYAGMLMVAGGLAAIGFGGALRRRFE